MKHSLKFIDLFAGLGGFHIALSNLGCECVFASELRDDLRRLYVKNFPEMSGETESGISKVEGDITKVPFEKIPSFDVLCGGFPCQPFSQAGKRQGFNDEKDRGNLFNYICEIARIHRPTYIFLENVSNLKGHDDGNTWNVIYHKLSDSFEDGGLNYEVSHEILSPHQFGIPQHRKRIYIVCKTRESGGLCSFSFPTPNNKTCDISPIINETETSFIKIKSETRQQLELWQEFIDQTVKHKDSIPSFPIWAMEFGATYSFEHSAPAYQEINELVGRRGHLGRVITGGTLQEVLSQLPVYARTDKNKEFPEWKKKYIAQNRAFYHKHKKWLDRWIKKVAQFENSHLKLEWNCGNNCAPTLEDKIIQFRASGIRVKLPTYSPALNLVGTQLPIFPWINLPNETLNGTDPKKGRYMTIKEAATLQGMNSLTFEGLSTGRSLEALGNAVNTQVVELIAKNLLR